MKQINFTKLKVGPKGKIIKKSNTVKHSKDNALEEFEQKELIRTINTLKIKEETKLRYRVLIALTMQAGLRISEAIQTRLSWINETQDGVTIDVPVKDRDIRNLKRDWKPKTEKGSRKVIFLDPAIGAMVKSFMISNKRGLGFSRQRAGQIIKNLGELINKPHLHPHALRSTYANNLIYSGVNVTTLQYYMGWAHINTALAYVRTSEIAARKDLLDKNKPKERHY